MVALSCVVTAEWDIWNIQQFCQRCFECGHQGLGVSFRYSSSLLSSGFGQFSGQACVPWTLYKKKSKVRVLMESFFLTTSLTSLFINTWLPFAQDSESTFTWHNQVQVHNLGIRKQCQTYQQTREFMPREIGKCLPIKSRTLMGIQWEIQTSKCLLVVLKDLIPMPDAWLPIYKNNSVELTQNIMMWWLLSWYCQSL